MAVYIQKGDRIDYKNETEAVIKSGDVVALGTNRIAVADCQIEVGAVGTLALTGVWEFPADTSAAIEFGALAYWDATSKTMKAAQSASEIPAGICVHKKESSGATVLVRLQDCLAAAGTPGPKGEKGDPGLGVPTPSGAGDAGKVPTVNEEGTGYELKAVGA